MSERVFSPITIRALMRLYQIPLQPQPDGSASGRIPWSVRPGAELTLSADGVSWSYRQLRSQADRPTNDTPPHGGDRLDFIMRMECVTRERASDMLYDVYPDVLERERIAADPRLEPYGQAHRFTIENRRYLIHPREPLPNPDAMYIGLELSTPLGRCSRDVNLAALADCVAFVSNVTRRLREPLRTISNDLEMLTRLLQDQPQTWRAQHAAHT